MTVNGLYPARRRASVDRAMPVISAAFLSLIPASDNASRTFTATLAVVLFGVTIRAHYMTKWAGVNTPGQTPPYPRRSLPHTVVGMAATPHVSTRETAAVAATLRAERAARRLTQEQVASRAGISPRTLIRFEQDQRTINLAQMVAICDALGVDFTYFLDLVKSRMVT